MTAPAYSLEALRRLREAGQQQQPPQATAGSSDPPTIPWRKWFATAPLEIDPVAKLTARLDDSGDVYTANCGGTPVWLVRQGPRWLMFAGSRRPDSRRRDFASPFLDHARRTAEAWYGPPEDGWRAEGPSPKQRRIAEAVDPESNGE